MADPEACERIKRLRLSSQHTQLVACGDVDLQVLAADVSQSSESLQAKLQRLRSASRHASRMSTASASVEDCVVHGQRSLGPGPDCRERYSKQNLHMSPKQLHTITNLLS